MNSPKIIGLTGGIGSGKTTIAKEFEKLGVAIYISDNEAKNITNQPEILEKIKKQFGKVIFDNLVLNRKKLATIVFNDSSKLQQLNAIIHPAVKIHFQKWLDEHHEEKFIIKESAILFETGEYKNCDYIISVVASLENKIERLQLRDGLTNQEILLRIKNQISDEERISKSDYVINNDILNISIMIVKSLFSTLNSQFKG